MPAPPPPVASASWSAFTSFRVRPTTSKRSSRSASTRCPLPRPPAAQRRAQFLQQPFVSHHQQRLRRLVQQVEKLAAIGAGVNVASIGEELHTSAAAGGVKQPRVEPPAQRFQNLVQLMHREAAPPEIG